MAGPNREAVYDNEMRRHGVADLRAGACGWALNDCFHYLFEIPLSFLNATLILGTLAAIVPIVLHLIARREPRKVLFPSIAFLTKRFESNRSRLRVRRWWLLAMRIAAVVALATALARPAIDRSLSLTWLTIALVAATGIALLAMASVAIYQGKSKSIASGLIAGAVAAIMSAIGWGGYTWASGPSVNVDTGGPVAIAILVDNSPTSAWRQDDASRLDTLKKIATSIVSQTTRGSRIAVLDRSSTPASFSIDAGSAASKIEQLRPRQTVTAMATRIDAAARLLRTSDLENKQLLILSDLTEATWDDSVEEAGLMDLLGEEPAVGVSVFDSGPLRGVNRSLSLPKLADATPPKGTPVTVTVVLSESGEEETGSDEQTATVELDLYSVDPTLPVVRDGEVAYPKITSVDRANVRVAGDTAAEVVLTIPPLDVGTHHGRIRVVGDDAVPLDDERFISIAVLPPSSVLIVSDDADEAAIMKQVIVASPIITGDDDAEFQVERIAWNDLRVARLADYDAVLLMNAPEPALSDDAIADYLAGGGGVMLTVGPQAGNAAVESTFAPNLVLRWRVPDGGTFGQVVAGNHPVTRVVAEDTPWNEFAISQYWQVATRPNDAVLMQYSGTDHAMLVARTVAGPNAGDTPGKLLMLTTPIPALGKTTRAWNGLFGTDPWPAWLLVRQCVEHLTGRDDNDAMAIVGRPQTVTIGGEAIEGIAEESTVDESSRRYQLFPPEGALPVPVEVASPAESVLIADIPAAGTYWLRGGNLPTGSGFSANLDAGTFDRTRISADRLDATFGVDRYAITDDPAAIAWSDNRATNRVSLHSPAMLLALIVFLLEQILGNRFYRSA